LLGRGGAGFPAGRKWSMLRKSALSYLVVNGDESEPATFKDHLLLERDPHQIIEGIVISAYALQVNQVFFFIRGEFASDSNGPTGRQRRLRTRRVGLEIFGSKFSLDIVVHPGAGAYICGDETALLEALEGKRAFRASSLRSFRRSMDSTVSRPSSTTSNDVEYSLDHFDGGAAFAALGRDAHRTRLFALAGG